MQHSGSFVIFYTFSAAVTLSSCCVLTKQRPYVLRKNIITVLLRIKTGYSIFTLRQKNNVPFCLNFPEVKMFASVCIFIISHFISYYVFAVLPAIYRQFR